MEHCLINTIDWRDLNPSLGYFISVLETFECLAQAEVEVHDSLTASYTISWALLEWGQIALKTPSNGAIAFK